VAASLSELPTALSGTFMALIRLVLRLPTMFGGVGREGLRGGLPTAIHSGRGSVTESGELGLRDRRFG
jgi:hypothetical protein